MADHVVETKNTFVNIAQTEGKEVHGSKITGEHSKILVSCSLFVHVALFQNQRLTKCDFNHVVINCI